MDEHYVPEPDDRLLQEAALEQEQMALEALAECARAGAKPDALETLAALLGLHHEWNEARP